MANAVLNKQPVEARERIFPINTQGLLSPENLLHARRHPPTTIDPTRSDPSLVGFDHVERHAGWGTTGDTTQSSSPGVYVAWPRIFKA